MPIKSQVRLEDAYIVDENGKSFPFKAMDVVEFNGNDETDTKDDLKIKLFETNKPITLQFKCSQTALKKFVCMMIGWKAKGPYRRRLMKRLIFGRNKHGN